jgi:ribulose-5-phosphate 4-epimerase/fuculose-1-phosphate aldolase
LADIIGEALIDRRIVLVYSHGTFATGQAFAEALNTTITFEENCRAICLRESLEPGETK